MRCAAPALLKKERWTNLLPGRVFDYPVHETWEFTSAHPIRSVFPLWLAYGWPMYILRWLWEGFGYDVSPSTSVILRVDPSGVLQQYAGRLQGTCGEDAREAEEDALDPVHGPPTP